ncbi:MAG: S-layer homology domain-containing protein [Oscillospiraceae bacterium]
MTRGVSEISFAPGKPLDRQEAATMLYRFAEATGRDVTARVDLNKFSDAAKVVGWAEEAMAWAVAEGLLKGYPGGQLCPRGNATRAEVCRHSGTL